MEPGAYVVTLAVALLAIGLFVLRVRQATGPATPDHYVAQPAPPAEIDRSVRADPPRSEALERPNRSEAGTITIWTQDEAIDVLSRVRIVGADGLARPISKRKIALVAGLRADQVGEMVRAARGEPTPPLVNPLRVRDERGERMISR